MGLVLWHLEAGLDMVVQGYVVSFLHLGLIDFLVFNIDHSELFILFIKDINVLNCHSCCSLA